MFRQEEPNSNKSFRNVIRHCFNIVKLVQLVKDDDTIEDYHQIYDTKVIGTRLNEIVKFVADKYFKSCFALFSSDSMVIVLLL